MTLKDGDVKVNQVCKIAKIIPLLPATNEVKVVGEACTHVPMKICKCVMRCYMDHCDIQDVVSWGC